MSMRQLLAISFVSLFLASCFLDSGADSERNQAPGKNGLGLTGKDAISQPQTENDEDAGICQFTAKSGCFQGQIPSAPELIVSGKSFFDANDLGQRFKELLTIEADQQGSSTSPKIEFQLLTPIDNRTFSRGFEVFVKGESAANTKVWNSGKFNLNKLPFGEYDIRVSKLIHLQIAKTITKPVVDANGVTTTVEEKVTKKFCASLHSEMSVEILKGKAINSVFDDYELYIPNLPCSEDSESRVLSL